MKKLLVVVDMKNDFITGSLGSKDAESIVDIVCKKIKDFNGDIVYTLDTHDKDYLSTQEGKNLPVLHCVRNTIGWKLNEKIAKVLENKKNVLAFSKETFGSVDLGEFVLSKNYDKIEFCGLCTDICVISNAMIVKAFLPEAEITVDAKACAGVTKESHLNALNAMKSCQIKIIN